MRGNAAKRKREEDVERAAKTNHKIMNFFSNGTATAAAPKPKVSSVAAVDAWSKLILLGCDYSRR